jgi:DNA-binding MarR family transcriptional regulator
MTDQRDQRHEQGERQDLAAMLHPLTRALVAAELPVLARHGVSMWGYVVLNALAAGPARTQAALAQAIGADKTRIIATLDELQEAGLITREPDPVDRRVRLLAISAAGRAVRHPGQRGTGASQAPGRRPAGLPAGGADSVRAADRRDHRPVIGWPAAGAV